MAEERLPSSISDLAERAQADPLTRLKLISRLNDVLIELGADPVDVAEGLASWEVIPRKELVPPTDTQIVILTRRDTKKNEKSIVIF